MKYSSGYKYVLEEDLAIKVSVFPDKNISTELIDLDTKGNLRIRKGWPSDGPSGPTLDTKSFMRGAFVHDALYQFMRRDFLSQSWRETIDEELRRICIADGMWKARAWWVYKGVRLGGLKSASAENRRKILEAP